MSFSTCPLRSEQTDYFDASGTDHSQNAKVFQGVLVYSSVRTSVCFKCGDMLFVNYLRLKITFLLSLP